MFDVQKTDHIRILVVDDNRDIHDDFKSIFIEKETSAADDELDDLLADVLDITTPNQAAFTFSVDSAYQGEEALQKVIETEAKNNPYDVIFMDVRMPPGWDGITTIKKIWEKFDHIEMVICTAFADISWEDMQKELGLSHRLLVLKKPFDPMEVKQLALSLSMKATYYKKYEHHIEELEREVAFRTQDLEKAKLNAELANKAKSTFLANMSHELRTPLNGVLGYAELLSQESLKPEQYFKLDTIQRCGQHLLDLIDNVLDLSKIESGQIVKEESAFNLRVVINDVAKMLQPKFDRKNILLQIEYDDTLPKVVKSDERKLRQILINLVGNAITHTEQGQVTIKSEYYQDTENPQIKFSVIDTGKGISPEDIAQIFKPFQQAQSTINNSGTGLGLAITKSFIELLGGQLEVISEIGEGSHFYFILEMQESMEAVNLPSQQQVVSAIKGSFKPIILIVSGADVSQGVLAGMLEHIGCSTICASNGSQALTKLKQISINLVISDVHMEPMGGLELLRTIRRDYKGLPVIMSSASVLSNNEQDYLKQGANGFLSKPIKSSILFTLIAEILDLEYEYKADSVIVEQLSIDFLTQIFRHLPSQTQKMFREDIANGNLKKIRENAQRLQDSSEQKSLSHYIATKAKEYDLDGLKQLFGKGESSC